MGAHRVVAIEVNAPGRPDDPHPAALQLDDGRQVSASRVVTELRYRVETYYVLEGEQAFGVQVVGPCPRCGLDFLRADGDVTTSDRLMRLPSSPFGSSLLPRTSLPF